MRVWRKWLHRRDRTAVPLEGVTYPGRELCPGASARYFTLRSGLGLLEKHSIGPHKMVGDSDSAQKGGKRVRCQRFLERALFIALLSFHYDCMRGSFYAVSCGCLILPA